MPWWLWLVVGLALFGAEGLVPLDFFLVFIGIAALSVGLIHAIAPIPTWGQILLFSAVAAGSLAFLRGPLMRRLGTGDLGDTGAERLVGELAVLTEDVAPGGFTKAELRGTVWQVKNVAEVPLQRGQRCRVRKVDGLTLWVSGEQA